MKDLQFEKPTNTVVKVDGNSDGKTASFTLSPLERGFGNTIGNSLRRILLSSLPGCAIVGVKIKGISHEFENLDGVVEDVITIIQNLKKVVLYTDIEEPDVQIEATISAHEGEVTAGDIICDDVEVINPDLHIATVAKGGELDMTLYIRRGVGYVLDNENKQYINTLDTIAIDSLYSPIVNVNYSIEKTRVDKDNSYDKLILNLTTDGSVSAKDAVAIASKIMIEHLQVLVEMSNKAVETDYMRESSSQDADFILDKTIEDLDLSVRSYNSLKKAGIQKVSDLTSLTLTELKNIRNLGKKSFTEIVEKIEDLGLNLKTEQ